MAATFRRAAVESALEAKGFRRRKGDHKYFIYYTEQGAKSPIRTKTSHGKGAADISDALIGRMAKQCKLRAAEFRSLIDCSMSQAQYEALLSSKGKI